MRAVRTYGLIALFLAAPFAVGADALAQQTNPIVAHFQAYRQALDANDLTTAETEAQAALAASQQRDGDGGRTAVLSFNLATLQLQREHYAAAIEPARRAFELARSRRQTSGLDEMAARIVLARAQMGRDGAVSISILRSALEQAERRDDLAGYRYDALAQLGNWALAQQNYPVARTAWADAAVVAALSGADGREARGRAKTNEGIALAAPWLDDRRARPQAGLDALAAFAEARPLLYTAAAIDAPDGALTPQQVIYARALAWDGAVRTRLRERNVAVPTSLSNGASAYGYLPSATPPECTIHMNRPAPPYPRSAEDDSQVGNVVVRIRFDERGQMRTADVAAGVGGQAFQDTAALGIRSWTAYYDTAAPTNCQVPAVYFARINYGLE